MDLQNLFCGYIWHPVQETGWFLGYAIGYVSVDASVDGIGYAGGYEIRDVAVYPPVDAGGIKPWSLACTES